MVKDNLIYLLIILIYLSPLTSYFLKIKRGLNFNIYFFIDLVNRSIYIYGLIGLILAFGMDYIEEYSANGNGNKLTDFITNMGLGYFFIGMFVTLPIIILLNIVRLINAKK